MSINNQLDYIDEKILEALTLDAKKSYLQIAKTLNISNSLVHQRIGKLKEQGVIKGFNISIDPKRLGYNTSAYMGIVLKEASYSYQVAEEMKKIPEIVSCDFVSGKYALFLRIVAANNDHLRTILYDKVHAIEGVGSTDTFISFGSEFTRDAPIHLRESS